MVKKGPYACASLTRAYLYFYEHVPERLWGRDQSIEGGRQKGGGIERPAPSKEANWHVCFCVRSRVVMTWACIVPGFWWWQMFVCLFINFWMQKNWTCTHSVSGEKLPGRTNNNVCVLFIQLHPALAFSSSKQRSSRTPVGSGHCFQARKKWKKSLEMYWIMKVQPKKGLLKDLKQQVDSSYNSTACVAYLIHQQLSLGKISLRVQKCHRAYSAIFLIYRKKYGKKGTILRDYEENRS